MSISPESSGLVPAEQQFHTLLTPSAEAFALNVHFPFIAPTTTPTTTPTTPTTTSSTAPAALAPKKPAAANGLLSLLNDGLTASMYEQLEQEHARETTLCGTSPAAALPQLDVPSWMETGSIFSFAALDAAEARDISELLGATIASPASLHQASSAASSVPATPLPFSKKHRLGTDDDDDDYAVEDDYGSSSAEDAAFFASAASSLTASSGDKPKRPPRKRRALNPEEQAEKRRRNKIAAAKCRDRKRELQSEVEVRVQLLRQENTELKSKMKTLEEEVSYLKNLLCTAVKHGTPLNR